MKTPYCGKCGKRLSGKIPDHVDPKTVTCFSCDQIEIQKRDAQEDTRE